MVRKSKKSQRDENSEGLTGLTGLTGTQHVETKSRLSGGQIAGIVFGILAVLALLFFYLRCVKSENCKIYNKIRGKNLKSIRK